MDSIQRASAVAAPGVKAVGPVAEAAGAEGVAVGPVAGAVGPDAEAAGAKSVAVGPVAEAVGPAADAAELLGFSARFMAAADCARKSFNSARRWATSAASAEGSAARSRGAAEA